MAQPPVGYGWFAQPDQSSFPYSPVNQTPFAPPVTPAWGPGGDRLPPFGDPFGGPPPGPPMMGWQQPGTGPFCPNGNAPPPPGGGVSIGFGFAEPPPPQTAPTFAEPSAPPSFENMESSEATKLEAGVRSIPITVIPSRPKPPRPQSPKLSHSPKPSPVSQRDRDEESSHQKDSRYQEGLKNMADLMTDVDLTDDVLTDLKKRFDTNK